LTPASKQVIDGNFTPLKEFLSHLKMPQSIRDHPNNMTMTLESFISYWKKAKENTSCYPSKISFATFKASSYDISLATQDCSMARIPLETGYSPKCWRHCVDVMIKKKSNMTDIDNLRKICLFEVDANYAIKHIGFQMMLNAELHSSIAKEQYGSRK
jgi:hypothetical protein